MAHTVFQTAQIMPINTHLVPTVKTLSSAPSNPLLPASNYRILPLCRKGLVVRNSSAIVDGESMAGLERCFRMSPSSPPECPPSSSSALSHGPVMKGGQFGAFGAVTQKQTKSSPELAIGGGGGNIGKSINFGGGDGGDDDGDDDDYFDDFDDGDEGDDGGLFRRRIILPELYDRKFLEAVLNEWAKKIMDLPSGLRQAYEMGK